MVNAVFTLYELSSGDDTEGEGNVSLYVMVMKIFKFNYLTNFDQLTIFESIIYCEEWMA